MAQVASLLVRLQADIDDYKKKMEQATEEIEKFKAKMNGVSKILNTVSDGFKDIGKNLTKYVTTPLMLFAGLSTKVTGDYESALNQVNRTLGGSSSIIKDFANNNALAFNMSEKAAMKYGAVYSNLLSSFISEQEDNAKLTESLLRQSAVVASWTGRSIEDVMERIRSGLLGNTEAIEDLGINVNVAMLESTEAFKKFSNGKSWNQLDFQTQQLIRLFAILEQSVDVYGEKLNETKLGSLAKMKALIEDIARGFGDILLPTLDELVKKYINPVLTWLKNLPAEGKKTIAIFAGIAAAIGPLLLGIGALIGAIAGLTAIMGFLAANPVVLTITGIIAAVMALAGVLIYLYNTNEGVKNAIINAWNNIKQYIQSYLRVIISLFNLFKDVIVSNFQNIWDSIVVTLKGFIQVIGDVFGFLNAMINGDWKGMWEYAKNILKTVFSTMVVTGINFADSFLSIFQKLSSMLLDGIFAGIARGFQNLVNTVLKGYNWVAGKIGLKTVGYLDIDIEKYKPSALTQKYRDELAKVANYFRGGEKTKLPSFSLSGVNLKDLNLNNLNKTTDNIKLDDFMLDIADTTGLAKDGVDKLADSVKNLVESIRQQTQSFKDSLGIFDTFERKVVSPERLMNRMKAQVKAMSQWTSALATLNNRGVNETFLNELRAMGPQNVDYIRALAQMSDEQLAQYQALYGQKYNIAQKEAERMVTTEQKIEKYVEQEITIQISGNKISSDDDVDRIAKEIVRKLKLKGV